MQKTELFLIIIVLLIAGNICLGVLYFFDHTEVLQGRKQLKVQQTSEKGLFFANLFVDKVLLGEGTVSFEDRLQLENAVRDISDKEIFLKWQEFTESKNDNESQITVGNLLKLLLVKIGQ